MSKNEDQENKDILERVDALRRLSAERRSNDVSKVTDRTHVVKPLSEVNSELHDKIEAMKEKAALRQKERNSKTHSQFNLSLDSETPDVTKKTTRNRKANKTKPLKGRDKNSPQSDMFENTGSQHIIDDIRERIDNSIQERDAENNVKQKAQKADELQKRKDRLSRRTRFNKNN